MLGLHTKTALLALTLLIAWGAFQMGQRNSPKPGAYGVEIAVEHTRPGGLSITHSIGGSAHLVDITNDSDETLGVSLPDTWERDEVRNVPLASLVGSGASLGFRRWTLPPNASVTFETDADIDDLSVHNPSNIPLRVRVTTVDLKKNTTNTDSYLLQENPLTLRF
jgi:hypothetical protein